MQVSVHGQYVKTDDIWLLRCKYEGASIMFLLPLVCWLCDMHNANFDMHHCQHVEI